MEILSLSVYNTEGKKIESLKLDQKVFDGTINCGAIYQDVLCHRAGHRKGLASTKTMGEAKGGGVKPWRQKGTGRARVGSIRSPLWRHGGVVFGPHPRDFSYRLPLKLKTLALKSSLNAKVKEGSLIVLDDFNLKNNKTKDALQVFLNLKLKDKKNKKMEHKNNHLLLLLDKIDAQLRQALRNLRFLSINLVQDTNAYEIIACKKLILTEAALNKLVKRIKK